MAVALPEEERKWIVTLGIYDCQTPGWMRASCGHYLSKILLSKSGVKNIIAGMVTSETDDWRKLQMVGRVIATPPKGFTAERYYQLIAPQVSLKVPRTLNIHTGS